MEVTFPAVDDVSYDVTSASSISTRPSSPFGGGRQLVFVLGLALGSITSGAGIMSATPAAAIESGAMTSDGAVAVAWVSTNPANLRTASSVQELRGRSGLTWDELARLFGVSRRAVHGWASGGRMNSANAARLQELGQVFSRFDGPPAAVRSALLAPDETGSSVYGRLVSAAHRPPLRPTVPLLARLGSVPDAEDRVLGEIVDMQELDD